MLFKMLPSGRTLNRYFNNNSLRTFAKFSPISTFSNRPLVLTRQSNFSSLIQRQNPLTRFNIPALKKPSFDIQITKRNQSTKCDNENHPDRRFDKAITTLLITVGLIIAIWLTMVIFGDFSPLVFTFISLWAIVYLLL